MESLLFEAITLGMVILGIFIGMIMGIHIIAKRIDKPKRRRNFFILVYMISLVVFMICIILAVYANSITGWNRLGYGILSFLIGLVGASLLLSNSIVIIAHIIISKLRNRIL